MIAVGRDLELSGFSTLSISLANLMAASTDSVTPW
jgi:hypothetical protein